MELDLREIATFTDFFIIFTCQTAKQAKATLEGLRERLKELKVESFGLEGEEEGSWILYDLGDIIVHIFLPEVRAHYDLEGLWIQAKKKVYLT